MFAPRFVYNAIIIHFWYNIHYISLYSYYVVYESIGKLKYSKIAE